MRASARPWAAAVAMFALFLQVLVPPGFMTAREGAYPAIVICTGHGPVLSRADLAGHPGKTANSRPDGTCAFAGHGASVSPPATPSAARAAVHRAPALVTSEAGLTPSQSPSHRIL